MIVYSAHGNFNQKWKIQKVKKEKGKWMLSSSVQVEDEKAIQNPSQITFTAHLCKLDDICTDVKHCYETILPKNYEKRFCDKEKVCCKSKSRYFIKFWIGIIKKKTFYLVCHDVKIFEAEEEKTEGNSNCQTPKSSPTQSNINTTTIITTTTYITTTKTHKL